MTQRLLPLLAICALVAQPGAAFAQDTGKPDRAQEQDVVEFECPEDLSGLPDLIQRRCRDATPAGRYSPVDGLNSQVARKGVRVFIPVAAWVATGIALTTLKGDKPVSR